MIVSQKLQIITIGRALDMNEFSRYLLTKKSAFHRLCKSKNLILA